MTPEMNRERAINLLNEFGLPLDEERITMIGDFLTIWIGWELAHVQQPATEPDERAQYEKWLESLPQCSDGCDGDLIGLDHDENCPLKGIGFATHWDAWQARAALALREPATGPGK